MNAQQTDNGTLQPSRDKIGLSGGLDSYTTPNLTLDLVRASQTVASLRSNDSTSFDFTPADWLSKRSNNGYFHLGDINLRWRPVGDEDWHSLSTAIDRQPIVPVDATASETELESGNQTRTILAAADLSPSLPSDSPLRIVRSWETLEGELTMRFDLTNTSSSPVEIGALGLPMVFNNILHERSLEEAHAVNSFSDPYIGQDAGYIQVTRLNGLGPALIVVPLDGSPLEAYNPLLSDSTQTGVTHEGSYEWMIHSKAYAENEWKNADPWNPPTSATLEPGESRSYGVRFLVAEQIRTIEKTLSDHDRPVAIGVPGYVVPTDLDASLFLNSPSEVETIDIEPAGALSFAIVNSADAGGTGWARYSVRGLQWGRARVTIRYKNGTRQSIHYKVIDPQATVTQKLGSFLTDEQWFDDPNDPFGRSPSVISYDYYNERQVTEDNRAWIAGLGDEGGSGSWLAAFMKQLVSPDPVEIRKLERFVDEVLWGGLQYSEGDLKYGVRKSLFYYEPERMPEGTYADSIKYGSWSSWSEEHARTVGRSYNYPHVAAAYWVLYRLARNHVGLVNNHDWAWYLRQASATSEAMVKHAPEYAQFGQMEGSIFLFILSDLKREQFAAEASALEATMFARAEIWHKLAYPFGSEMPWDSTGQEEVYAWCSYFGFDEKAAVTINAILGYMPIVPHWGYNGSARRFWDFWYAGHPRYSRLERQLHHYGSGLNAVPIMTEYRSNPDDFHLLRVGYGGLMGAIANITEDGFGPSGFHSYPSTLAIDGYSGDYGPNFLGHAINTGTYVVEHPNFGWLSFGGNLSIVGSMVSVEPRDASRSRVFIAPLGLWLTLDAGTIQSFVIDVESGNVTVSLDSATSSTPNAYLRIERTSSANGSALYAPIKTFHRTRDAYSIPLGPEPTKVSLSAQ